MAVKEGWRGRFFEDFEVGDVYEHPLGRTVTTTDNIRFTLLSQNTAPVLFHFHNYGDHRRTLLPERDQATR
jgi:acyl dehydratase